MLTLYIIPGDNKGDPARARKSFGDIVTVVSVLKSRRIDQLSLKTEFYGYIYDNEYLEEAVMRALPVFLDSAHFDCLILFKKVMNEHGRAQFFRAPRIFKSHIKLKNDELVPEMSKGLRFETLLDGFVLEDDR